MELICNELSYYPLADSNSEAERRFSQLLATFKEANIVYGFKRIRFHSDYANQFVTNECKFYEWIPSVSNSNLKNTILSFFRKPFADDDLENDELEMILESEYKITDEEVSTASNPVGLPIAYLKSIPTLSFDSHLFWRNRKINLLKATVPEIENLNFIVYNLCLHTDLETTEIEEWADQHMSDRIDSKEMLIRYLSYSTYDITCREDFLRQLFEWKENNTDLFRRILLLMKDVQLHPFSGGIGKTENLRNRGKEASKRITREHRLSYEINENVVTFITCRGHYEFH